MLQTRTTLLGAAFPRTCPPLFAALLPRSCGMPRATYAWASAACFFFLCGCSMGLCGSRKPLRTPGAGAGQWLLPLSHGHRSPEPTVSPDVHWKAKSLGGEPEGQCRRGSFHAAAVGWAATAAPAAAGKERETIKSLSRTKSARNCMASIITSLCCWVCFLTSFF